MSLNILLIECDNQRSLGGSCFRDMLNVYTRLQQWALVHSTPIRQVVILTIDPLSTVAKNKFSGLPPIVIGFDVLNNYKQAFDTFTHSVCRNDWATVLITGHGYQRPCGTLSETDGLDEYIAFNQGTLVDNEIRTRLVQPLVNLTKRTMCLADTCHSGSLFDNTPADGGIFSLSACSDAQTDSCDIGNSAGFGGALTVHLLDQPDVVNTLLCGSVDDIRRLVGKISIPLQKLGQSPLFICPM